MSEHDSPIVFVCSGREYGGAEYYLELLGAGVRHAGVTPLLVGDLPISSWPGPQRNLGIGPKWSKSSIARSTLRAARERRAYLKAITETTSEIVHMQFKREQILLTSAVAQSRTVIWTEHGIFPGGLFGRLLAPLYVRASKSVAEIVCVSDAVQESLLRIGVRASLLTTIINPVDTDRFAPNVAARQEARRSLEIDPDDTVLLTLSRVEHAKGIDRAIESLRYLPHNVCLLIAGTGTDEEDVRLLSGPFGERVRFLGFRTDPERLLAAADLFLLPSRAAAREGTPMSLLQAMAAGVPPVATADSGLAGWVTGRGGLSSGSDPAELALAIEKALGMRSELSIEARQAAEPFNADRWRDDWLKIFNVRTSEQ